MRSRMRMRAAIGLTLAGALILAACGNGEDPIDDVAPDDTTVDPGEDAEDVDDEGGLIIDGELIADAATWEAAQDEGEMLPRAQAAIATNSLNFSDGVIQPSVWRGRSLSSAAMASSC